MKLLVRGDVDGFLGLGLDSLVNLLIVTSLCQGVLGFSPALIYGRILPGAAISFLLGNLLFARLAHRLSVKTGRTDVCALPYGLNTPTMIAYVLLVMGPARQLAQASGATDPDRVAWQAGLVACLCSGVVEFAVAFAANLIRRVTPRAAMLATLAGIGLSFLTMGFLLQAVARPIVGLTTLAIMLLVSFGGVRFRFGLSGILLAVLAGTSLSWATGLAPVGKMSVSQLGFYLPVPVFADLWHGLSLAHLLPYLSVILPMSLLSAMSSLQNIESAEAAGDAYPARPALIINGLGTLCAACFGSPFPLTIYIGHPGWKALGARAGYSTLNGIFVTLLCLTGATSIVAWFVPSDAGLAIVVWIGLVIVTQAFGAVPARHMIAVVIGLLPALGALIAQTVKTALRSVGTGTPGHPLFDASLLDLFHHNNSYIEGAFALEQGFVFSATIWATMVVYIVERRFRIAALWSSIGALFSLLGLIHTWKWTPNDTVLSMPLLDQLTGQPVPPGWSGLFPGWPYALAYILIALILLLADKFSLPEPVTEMPPA